MSKSKSKSMDKSLHEQSSQSGKPIAAAALALVLLGFAGAPAHATDNGSGGLLNLNGLTNTALNTVNNVTSGLSLNNGGGSADGNVVSSLTGTVGDLTSSVTNTAGLSGNLDSENGQGGLIVGTIDTVETAVGDVVAVDLQGDNLVEFEADKNTVAAAAKLNNSAAISSQRLGFQQAQADQVLNSSVNLNGVSQAKSVSVSNGAITLQ